ncbi:metallophosphoesterase [Maribellus sp. YY47]|uniref:metallophosphoesterase family protein n=1 Tax=Maribellus sp. YY47 TaxID=2929486 RepID=UPI002000A8FE|nr:metallophosphoesterase [Maribellus sp. YY47]MCK3684726.1 metallophosphoesterase [Maribellus sp. YY47]
MRKLRTKLKIVTLLLGLLWNVNVFGQADTLSVLHITDLHLLLKDNEYMPEIKQNRENKGYLKAVGNLNEFLKTVPKQTESDLVVATGDLIDFYNAEGTDGNMQPDHVKLFSRFIKSYKKPLLLTLGNHDMFSYRWQNDKMKVDQLDAGEARAAWIKDTPCFKDGTYYSKIYEVDGTSYRFIFLDNSFYWYEPKPKNEIPYMSKAQLYWLKNELEESDDDVEIVFMHIPLTEEAAEEGAENGIYEVLARHPSCKLILSGHKHQNTYREYPAAGDNKLIQVETGALVRNVENWRLIRFTKDNILVSSPGVTRTELVVPLK